MGVSRKNWVKLTLPMMMMMMTVGPILTDAVPSLNASFATLPAITTLKNRHTVPLPALTVLTPKVVVQMTLVVKTHVDQTLDSSPSMESRFNDKYISLLLEK